MPPDESADHLLADARALFQAGHPEEAFVYLEALPESALTDATLQLQVALEMQLALLAWRQDSPGAPLLRRFCRAQQQFYKAVYILPHLHQAYVCQAQFWVQLGQPGMARRLLRSVLHAAPDAAAQDRLLALTGRDRPPTNATSPPHYDPSFRPRVLVITYKDGDSGMDVLYDGLCRVLGPERVQEYPYKSILHGEIPEGGYRHPSACTHPAAKRASRTLSKNCAAARTISSCLPIRSGGRTERKSGASYTPIPKSLSWSTTPGTMATISKRP